MAARELKLIDEDLYNHEQSWCYDAIYQYGQNRIKLEIRRNSYDNQSYLKGFLFDSTGNRWNQVVWKPMVKSVECYECKYFNQAVDRLKFKTTANTILNVVMQLLK